MTPERVQELLDKATPAPWRLGRQDLDHEDRITQDIPTRNIPLLLAAPEIAAAYLDLTRRVGALVSQWEQFSRADGWEQEVMHGEAIRMCADELAEVLHKAPTG